MDANYLTFINFHPRTNKQLPPLLWTRNGIRSTRSTLKGNLKILQFNLVILTQGKHTCKRVQSIYMIFTSLLDDLFSTLDVQKGCMWYNNCCGHYHIRHCQRLSTTRTNKVKPQNINTISEITSEPRSRVLISPAQGP